MRRPDFFIVGAARCGTTSMAAYLGEHPEVFVASQGFEPTFFGSDISYPGFVRDEREYLALFAGAGDAKRAGEKSVGYLYSRRAAQEIKAFAPKAAIIIMLRDPVELIASLHAQRLYRGIEDLTDLGEALGAEEERLRGRRIPQGWCSFEPWFYQYRETARCAEQVRRFLEAFGEENVHIVVLDDLAARTDETYRGVLRFLGVDEGFRPSFRKLNARRAVRSMSLQGFLREGPGLVRSSARASLKPGPLRRLAKGLLCLNSRPLAEKPVDPELAERLREEFREEVERLGELIGRDLTHWSRPR